MTRCGAQDDRGHRCLAPSRSTTDPLCEHHAAMASLRARVLKGGPRARAEYARAVLRWQTVGAWVPAVDPWDLPIPGTVEAVRSSRVRTPEEKARARERREARASRGE